MAILINYRFETGLGTWTSETDADGHLNWSEDATAKAVASSAGAVKVDILDTNAANLHQTITADTSGIWRARFYFDPNSVAWPNSSTSTILQLDTGSPNYGQLGVVKFGKNGSGSYVIEALAQNDTAYTQSPQQVITDAPHWIEIEVTRSSGSNNGRLRLWIDSLTSALYDSGAVIDNDTKANQFSDCYFGAIEASYSAPGGAIYFDELIVNNTGAEIGPLGSPSPSASPSPSPSASPSASASASPSASPSASASRSPSPSPSASPSESIGDLIVGSVCWGHVTGVTETNKQSFSTNWTGTGSIVNPAAGDTEYARLASGQYLISEMVNTGAGANWIVEQNHYDVSGENATLSWRTGADMDACGAAAWTEYSAPFSSLGVVQVKIEYVA